jgi:hypothetical protein
MAAKRELIEPHKGDKRYVRRNPKGEDDELAQINGNREQLEGKIQAKYGYAKDKAKQEVDAWCNRMK